jgi:AcrR family transcriptional regulator
MELTVRERLLDAATDLFASEGYDAVGIEKLRARAGISNGSFFHLFAAKDDLAAELLVNCVIAYQAAIITALSRCDDATTGVAAIVRTHIRWVMENQSKARFMLDDARAAWFAKAADRLKTHNATFAAAVEHWRKPLIARSQLRDVSIEVFLATVIGPANLICRSWITGRKLSATSPIHNEQELIALAQHALVTAPSRARKVTDKARNKKNAR